MTRARERGVTFVRRLWDTRSMDFGDLLTIDGIVPVLRVKDKTDLLQQLSQRAATAAGLTQREVFDALLHRERLGSTGFGRGIAIPHVKFRALSTIVCIFARLAEPVAFDAPDGEPVDIVFLLLGPEHASGDHLKALARISRLVRAPRALERLRAAKDKEALYAVLTEPATSHAA
jgi:nitrogen PTS system EIIA component